MEYSADFSSSRHNLGNLYARLDRTEDAVSAYEAAIRIDNRFFPAKANLALLYNQRGQNDRAEELFRELVTASPERYEMAYSLGLLLAEMQKYREAVPYLEQAAKGLPDRARIRYNLGLIYQYLEDFQRAEIELRGALDHDLMDADFQFALADFYLRQGLFEKARPIVEDMVLIHPENPVGIQILDYIQRNAGEK